MKRVLAYAEDIRECFAHQYRQHKKDVFCRITYPIKLTVVSARPVLFSQAWHDESYYKE